jgi:hypothetical protein
MAQVPWEFLQGVAERKQKGFDQGLAETDALDSLLKGIRVHDVYQKDLRTKQETLNKGIEAIRNDLQNTGDYSGASRKIMNLKRDMQNDNFLTYAPEYSKKIWADEEDISKNKEGVSNYNMFYPGYMSEYKQNMYTPDGRLKAYNPGQLYEKDIDLDAEAKKIVGNIANSGYLSSGETWDMERGIIYNTTTGATGVGNEKLKNVVAPKVQDFLQSQAGKQFMRRNNSYSDRPLTIQEQADKAYKFLINSNLHQLGLTTTNKTDSSFIPDSYYERRKENTPKVYTPDVALEVFDLGKANYNFEKVGVLQGPGGYPTETRYPETYKNLNEPSKKILDSYFYNKKGQTFNYGNISIPYKEIYNKLKNGELTADESKLLYEDVNKYKSTLNQVAKQNANAATLSKSETKSITQDLIGKEAEEFDANILIEGRGGLPKNTLVYSIDDGTIIPISEIPIDKESKSNNAFINKEYSAKSPFYQMFGNDPKYAQPHQLVITDKNGKTKAYVIPNKSVTQRSLAAAAINQVNSAIQQPNNLTPTRYEDIDVKFVPSVNQFQLKSMQDQGQIIPGTFEIYKDGIKVETQNPLLNAESATIEIETLKQSKKK